MSISYHYPVRITVLKKLEMPDLYADYANRDKTHITCENQALGKEFISYNAERPDGFCNRAWNAFYDKVKLLAAGKDSPWVNKAGIEIVSCPDGLHPVICKLERLASY